VSALLRPLSFLVVACALTLGAPARALSDEEIADRVLAGHGALGRWQLDVAAVLAEDLDRAAPEHPLVDGLLGMVKFHQGDFAGALALLERAGEAGVDEETLTLVKRTAAETRDAVAKESAHFVVRTPRGKDELLADIALEKLEIAFAAITKAFDFVPKHKIAVDVLHDARGLAEVSTLTVQEIETSGTIALCKYNRLMITSPKALARGYSWIDTLSHELVHLVISEKSKNSVPIWLHEGLAKYSESLWRGAPGLALGAASENILAAGVKSGKLITFEQMHPSMAKLPSQHDTTLAFAEVFTVIEFLHAPPSTSGRGKKSGRSRASGFAATNALLDALGEGLSMDAALKRAVGMDLAGLQRAWKASLQKRKFKLTPGAEPARLTFVKNARTGGSTVDEQEDEGALESAGKSAESRRFVRLGGLLRRRGHARAAAIEYQRAHDALDVPSSALANRLALLYLELDDVERAQKILATTVKVFPDDPQTRVLLGRVALKARRFDDALAEYERATWENPMNPEIWVAFHQIGTHFGDTQLTTRAEGALALLSRHARAHGRAKEQRTDAGPSGTLSVRSAPWGELVLDGTRTGMTTPVVELRVAPGPHIVRVHDAVSGRQARARVVVDEGEAARVELELAPVDEKTLTEWIEEEQRARAPREEDGDSEKDGGAPAAPRRSIAEDE